MYDFKLINTVASKCFNNSKPTLIICDSMVQEHFVCRCKSFNFQFYPFKVHHILTGLDIRDKESKQLGQNAQGITVYI